LASRHQSRDGCSIGIEARFVMGAGALIAVLGLFCASRSHGFEPLLLLVDSAWNRLGASTWLAAATVIANWFPDRRGMALGIVTAGMEAGRDGDKHFTVGTIIAAHGWRGAIFRRAFRGF